MDNVNFESKLKELMLAKKWKEANSLIQEFSPSNHDPYDHDSAKKMSGTLKMVYRLLQELEILDSYYKSIYRGYNENLQGFLSFLRASEKSFKLYFRDLKKNIVFNDESSVNTIDSIEILTGATPWFYSPFDDVFFAYNYSDFRDIVWKVAITQSDLSREDMLEKLDTLLFKSINYIEDVKNPDILPPYRNWNISELKEFRILKEALPSIVKDIYEKIEDKETKKLLRPNEQNGSYHIIPANIVGLTIYLLLHSFGECIDLNDSGNSKKKSLQEYLFSLQEEESNIEKYFPVRDSEKFNDAVNSFIKRHPVKKIRVDSYRRYLSSDSIFNLKNSKFGTENIKREVDEYWDNFFNFLDAKPNWSVFSAFGIKL